MTSILSIGASLPEFRYTNENVEKIGIEWLKDKPEQLALFKRFTSSSKISNRHFILPPSRMLSLNGMAHRAELFEEHATPLACDSLEIACQRQNVSLEDLETLVFASCTCPTIPSIDGLIVDKLNLDRNILRVPIYQHGCAGGVAGLRIASELSKVRGLVSLTSVELCSLVFQKENPTGAQLVGAAIFADGAASVVLSPENTGLVIRDSQSFLIPNTRHLMGYDILDDGPHLRLDRNLPQALIHTAPHQIKSFLNKHNLSIEEIDYWLFHPGGSKILDFLESHLCREPSQSRWSREIFESIGNLSSTTILFILDHFLKSNVCQTGDKIVMLGIGPGLTIELILFEWMK